MKPSLSSSFLFVYLPTVWLFPLSPSRVFLAARNFPLLCLYCYSSSRQHTGVTTMPSDPLSPENLLSTLSRPYYLGFKSLIRLPKPKSISSVHRNCPSSLGSLDYLPNEVLFLILDELDFPSLSRFSRVSLRGKSVVESIPAYQALVKNILRAVDALQRTGLIDYHSPAKVYETLVSSECVMCKEFGPYLFLLTCERCCYTCRFWSPTFWAFPPSIACKLFSLSESQVNSLPTMRIIPLPYGEEVDSLDQIHQMVSPTQMSHLPESLVSVREAKKLAISIHDSIEFLHERIEAFKPRRIIGSLASDAKARKRVRKYEAWKLILDAPLDPSRPDEWVFFPFHGHYFANPYSRFATMDFPVLLADKTVEDGIWCRGCYHVSRDQPPAPPAVPGMGFEDYQPRYISLKASEQRAWTEEEFLDHVKWCPGSRHLIPELRVAFPDTLKPRTADRFWLTRSLLIHLFYS